MERDHRSHASDASRLERAAERRAPGSRTRTLAERLLDMVNDVLDLSARSNPDRWISRRSSSIPEALVCVIKDA